MTWTYNVPAQDDHDRIRLLVGDTDTTDQQLQDEEIDMFLSLEGNSTPSTVTSTRPVLYRSAAASARAIAAKYARLVSQTLGKRQDAYSDLLDHYQTLAKMLLDRASASGIAPRVGGLSISDKISSQMDTDLVQPFFTRDMQQEPGTSNDFGDISDQEAQEFAP